MADKLDIRTKIAQVRGIYDASVKSTKGHFLIVGEKGAGKTTLFETCPQPILIHSFDPDGTSVLDQQLIKLGKIIVDNRFEQDDPRDARAYLLWENEFNEWKNNNLFAGIGTYGIDSLTTMATSIIWQIQKKEKRVLAEMSKASDLKQNGMQIQDWGIVLTIFQQLSRVMTNLPCHTIMLGHIERDKDEVTQSFVRTLLLPGQSRNHVPIAVPELLVLKRTISGKRVLLTQPDGEYQATTRMGKKGIFLKEEEPDIRALLKKAGKDWQDMEAI